LSEKMSELEFIIKDAIGIEIEEDTTEDIE
jgi:hypothetical protein